MVRLADSYASVDAQTTEGAGPTRAWHVVILTDGAMRRLYTTMTQDIGAVLHRSTSALAGGGYAQENGIGRLVLAERYACRHTAFARMMRIRGWPVAERRRLIEASNPAWAALAAEEAAAHPAECTQPTTPKASSAAHVPGAQGGRFAP